MFSNSSIRDVFFCIIMEMSEIIYFQQALGLIVRDMIARFCDNFNDIGREHSSAECDDYPGHIT